ncbi:MAG: methyltransferase domain-containing protein [Promethearchaeota archaeon]|nr:MAG: methyltransferase domain-containing protein [Candidatus Lokiarchaeota archaeon]
MTDEDAFLEYANYHNIADFKDLSIKDIITLQFLVRYQKPIVRHLLYTEVKQFIEFKEKVPYEEDHSKAPNFEKKFFDFVNKKKKIYPPSFYNMLDNMEEKGLLRFRENHSGKLPNIEDTPYTNYIPQLLLKFLINNNVMVSEEFREDFSKKFLEKIENQKFERILSIWFSEYVVPPIIKQISEFSKEQYILHKNGTDQALSNSKMKNIKFTEMISKHISVPENIFDGVIIPVHKKFPKFHDMERTEILKEIARVLRSDGLLIFVAIAEVPFTKNIFLNELIKLYNLSLHNRIFSEIELKKDMNIINLKQINIFEHQGLLIGIGKNP